MKISNDPGAHPFLADGGVCGAHIRAIDWASTSLGPVETWPQSLRSSVSICLHSNFPICIYWGPDLVLLYNDSWAPIPGNKHPWALGKTAGEVWPEIWDEIHPLFVNTFRGQATGMKDGLLLMHRHGYTEECFFDFTFTPIYGDDGQVGGVFNAVIETTYRVLNERRTGLLQALNKKTAEAAFPELICREAVQVLEDNKKDVPFAMIYLPDGQQMRLSAASFDPPEALKTVGVGNSSASELAACFQSLLGHRNHIHLADAAALLGPLPAGAWPEPAKEALLLPLAGVNRQTQGVLVAGISPRRALDDAYVLFLENLADSIARELTRAQSLTEERRRAKELAELDRAKTTFFSNISHEFRTPLTLILGPLEEMLQQGDAMFSTTQQAQLDAAHRNSMRLLRLVNMLLDFSRIEAGRLTARYRPTDLAAFTADLASSFHSTMEKAGLRYTVDTAAMAGVPVYVDADLWEKILLNLLSNAFKYTLSGEICLSLRPENGQAVLRVTDTGIGIPAKELPRMFERFHRVQNATGRTHEGSGIGLSLVQELVRMHGGDIQVESVEGRGSTFTVRLPLGAKHLPSDQVSWQAEETANRSTLATTLVSEAAGLAAGASASDLEAIAGLSEVNDVPAESSHPEAEPDKTPVRILVVDDNTDMRAYIRQLLAQHYEVETAINGQNALEKFSGGYPDLIISDVMMPVMNGVELVKTLKGNAATAMIPVILLSARAGEEARVDGYDAGADDYLSKPFTGRELLARVRSQLAVGRTRRRVDEQLRNLFRQAPFSMIIYRGNDLRFELANDMALKTMGKSWAELADKPVAEVFPERVTRDGFALHQKVLRTGKRQLANEYELTFVQDGQPHTGWYNAVYEPLFDDRGRPTGVLAVGYEVTAQVLARQKVETAEARMRLVFMQSPVAINVYRGPELRVELANEAALAIMGKTWEEVAGRPIAEVFPNVAERFAIHRRVFDTGQRETLREAHVPIRRSGEPNPAWYDSEFVPLLGEDGAVTGVVAVGYDITEKVLARRKIEESERELLAAREELERKIAERTVTLEQLNRTFNYAEQTSLIGSLRYDFTGGAFTFSDNLYRILGCMPGEFSPAIENILSFIHPDDLPHMQAERQKFLRDGEIYDLDFRVVRKDGRVIYCRNTAVMFEENGQKVVIGTLQDISKIKTTEQQLHARNAELEKSNRSLEQFAHIASHDLQEPLRKIQTFSDLLRRRSDDPAEQEKYLEKIDASARRMSQLIQSVLNYSRISKSQDLAEPTDLNKIMKDVCTDFELLIEEKEAVVETGPLPTVSGVPLQLSQLFSNLLSNALKFSTVRPHIRVAARPLTRPELAGFPQLDPGRSYVHITFEDNGIGFEEQYAERIFDIFQRLHNRQTFAGTGIGLALCRKIVENHGGEILAEGRPGKGAIFHIYLPAR